MNWIDWVILVVPVCFVMGMGLYSRKYVKDVSDFLVAGRVCGRYVLTLGDVANAISILTLVAYIEQHYKTGFSVGFWGSILAPLGIVLGLTGFCTYRFRETRAMSLGQFLEMRYSRKFRIFAAALRSLSEMLANMIMPAIAARFFIQMLNLPDTFCVFGVNIPTFVFLVILFLFLAISLICMGGTLALVVTDTIQGFFLYPLLACFVIFVLSKFNWDSQIMPTMIDRIKGESFINPYDIEKLRDFNLFSVVIVAAFNTVMHRASWIGAGTSSAAKSPHEQKMASLLGGWRWSLIGIFYLLISISLITFLNHADFAQESNMVRQTLATRVADDVLKNEPLVREHLKADIAQIPVEAHVIGVSPKLSQDNNPDATFLSHIHTSLKNDYRARAQQEFDDNLKAAQTKDPSLQADQDKLNKTLIDAEGQANDLFQQCRTLFHQLTLSVTMRHLLPTGLFGMFCLLLFLAMLSTDDTRIFSATLTIAQDVVLPFKKKPFTPEGHVRMIRIVAISIGVFFFCGSFFMAQLDYINMFVTLACAMWLSGCGPIMVFGLYSRFGTTAGAWSSLLSGMFCSLAYILIQRNWADYVYPFLKKADLVDICDKILIYSSKPFDPWIVWKMDAVKCPVNSFEFSFFCMVFTLIIYIVVSYLTCKEPFNLDRMLHRGKYSVSEKHEVDIKWNLKTIFKNMVGITSEYTFGDKLIAYGVFTHSFIYGFCLCFCGTVVWNTFSPWSIEYWSRYFFICNLIVPGFIAFFSTFWFGIGGIIDLFRLFHDLEHRTANHLDDGRVEGNVSLAEKAAFEEVEAGEDTPESNMPNA